MIGEELRLKGGKLADKASYLYGMGHGKLQRTCVRQEQHKITQRYQAPVQQATAVDAVSIEWDTLSGGPPISLVRLAIGICVNQVDQNKSCQYTSNHEFLATLP